jgi:hypothetical protein
MFAKAISGVVLAKTLRIGKFLLAFLSIMNYLIALMMFFTQSLLSSITNRPVSIITYLMTI